MIQIPRDIQNPSISNLSFQDEHPGTLTSTTTRKIWSKGWLYRLQVQNPGQKPNSKPQGQLLQLAAQFLTPPSTHNQQWQQNSWILATCVTTIVNNGEFLSHVQLLSWPFWSLCASLFQHSHLYTTTLYTSDIVRCAGAQSSHFLCRTALLRFNPLQSTQVVFHQWLEKTTLQFPSETRYEHITATSVTALLYIAEWPCHRSHSFMGHLTSSKF